MSKSSPKPTLETTNHPSHSKQAYFFPNLGGKPFSVEATSHKEAEEAFAAHLKTTKENA